MKDDNPGDLDPYISEAFAEDGTSREAERRIMAATLPVLRRRRWARRAGSAGLAIVLYAAGAWSAGFAARRSPQAVVRGPGRAAPPAPAGDAETTGAPGPVRRPEAGADPAELRAAVAGAPRAEQVRLLIRAGDLYLERDQDIEAALHCYRQARELGASPADESGRGSWLFAALTEADR